MPKLAALSPRSRAWTNWLVPVIVRLLAAGGVVPGTDNWNQWTAEP